MADKRKIVIKVSYPASGKVTGNSVPRMITEWNIRRILFAVGVLLLILGSIIYVISGIGSDDSVNATVPVIANETSKTSQSGITQADIKNLAIPKQAVRNKSFLVKPIKKNNQISNKDIIKKQQGDKVTNEHGYSKDNNKVSRTSLTYRINNKEPTTEIAQSVSVSKKKPQWLYYFTELKAMKGNNVYHEWLKNGVVVSKQKLHVSGDAWRTSSRKLFSDAEKGKWSVRLLDEKGQLLNERKFKVE